MKKRGEILDKTTEYILIGAGVIGGVYLLYKSDFFGKIGTGVQAIGEGTGGGVYQVGAGVGTGVAGLGVGTGLGVYQIGTGVEQIGAGLGSFLDKFGNLGTGGGNLLSGLSAAQIVSEVINKTGYQYPDFNKSSNNLKDSGVVTQTPTPTPTPSNNLKTTPTSGANSTIQPKTTLTTQTFINTAALPAQIVSSTYSSIKSAIQNINWKGLKTTLGLKF